MIHLGDITKIDGYKAPVVDCVIGGSPCQDLSVAGLRKGLQHSELGDEETTRSGLFMEQIRLVKEMRESDRRRLRCGRSDVNIRPRYMVWENVPGAFSSNKGEDFRVVLEEVARISEADVSIPRPEKGKWSNAGVIIGDNYSIAWRVFDAQYWGVPQRRRRICLVADFNGHSAAEIVFNQTKYNGCTIGGNSNSSSGSIGDESRSEVQPFSEGLSGNSEQSGEEREEVTSDASGSIGAGYPAFTYQDREGCPGGGKGFLLQEDRSASLRTNNFQTLFQPTYSVDMGGGKSACDIIEDKSPTLCTTHYGEPAVVYDARGNGDGKTSCNLTSRDESSLGDYSNVVIQQVFRKTGHPRNSEEGQGWEEADKSDTLNVFDNSEARTPTVVVSMDRETFNSGKNFARTPGIYEDGIQPTLVARGPGAVAYKEVISTSNGTFHMNPQEDIANTLRASDYKDAPLVAYQDTYQDTVGTLMAKMSEGYCGQDDYNDMFVVGRDKRIPPRYIVRRLTPLECERLQGYPDGWTDIGEWTDSNGKKKKLADSNRYKALGNSIALPSWRWVLKRMCGFYERPATMASLFDGIGGFPLIWESINGKGSCLWASEIEDFPMAVTKERFK